MSAIPGMHKAHQAFWSFADITVIHGFGYAARSRHVLEAIIWLLAVGACIALAVNDLYNLVTTYLAQPTSTNTIIHYNATSKLALPNPVICIDAKLECLNFPQSSMMMMMMGYPGVESPPNISAWLPEIEAAFSAAPNSFVLSDLSAPAIATVIRMFSLIAAMEDINLGYNFAGQPQNPPNDYPSTGVFELYYANTPGITYFDYSTLEPLYTLRTTLSAAGVNFTELTWQIGEFICDQFLPYAVTVGYSLMGACSRANITWVGSGALRTAVCTRVDGSFFSFTSDADSRTIGVCNSAVVGFNQSAAMPCQYVAQSPQGPGGTGIPPAFNSSVPLVYDPGCASIAIQTSSSTLPQPTFYFDPGGERRYSSSSPDWVIPYVSGTVSTTRVAIAAIYNSVSTNDNPCTTNDTITECTLRCRKAFFVNTCGCYPVSLFSLAYDKPASMPYCVNLDLSPPLQQNGSTNYMLMLWGLSPLSQAAGNILQLNFSACLAQNFQIQRPLEACLSSCVHECQTTTFTVTSLTTGATPQNVYFINSTIGAYPPYYSASNVISESTIEISRWLYPEYQESLLMSPASFLSSFGGSLGIWLGASIISLAHVAVHFVGFVMQHCCGKRHVGLNAIVPPEKLYEARPTDFKSFHRPTRY